MVSGVAALIWSQRPDLTLAQVRQILLDSVTPLDSLQGKVKTGGMLNARRALELTIAAPFGGIPIDGFPGWLASPWYLNYNIEFWPWIFHDEHGWQFVSQNSTEEVIFLWDLGLGEWIFLNEDAYRWVFLFGGNSGWIWTFGDNKPGRRFFQQIEDGSLFSIPPGLPID